MESVSIDDHFQSKYSSNGEDTISFSSTSFTPIRERMQPAAKPHLSSISQNPRQLALYQAFSHYCDVLYASDEELSATNAHNEQLITSLCLHVLNHVMKVRAVTVVKRRRPTLK